MGKVTTLEQLARNFGEEIGRAYKEELYFWRSISMDNRKKIAYWEERIKTEVPIVVENAQRKILEIMNYHPRQRKKYCLRKFWLFKYKYVLNINHKNEFYKDLLVGENLNNFFPINVEYHIDLRNLSFEKVTLPYKP